MRQGLLTGDWDKLKKDLERMGSLLEKNLATATKINAMRLVDGTKDTIRSGRGMVALQPETIKRKGSSKPLIDYADMLNAITHKLITKLSFFIGIPRTAKRKKGPNAGEDLVNIGEAHEKGAPKANIPARPFIHPTIQRMWKSMVATWKGCLRDTLRGETTRAHRRSFNSGRA